MLGELIRKTRENKNLLMRELAAKIEVDIAQISRFEKEDRKPTREQVKKLAVALDIEYKQLLTLWLSEKVYENVQGEEVATDAIKLALKRIKTER